MRSLESENISISTSLKRNPKKCRVSFVGIGNIFEISNKIAETVSFQCRFIEGC